MTKYVEWHKKESAALHRNRFSKEETEPVVGMFTGILPAYSQKFKRKNLSHYLSPNHESIGKPVDLAYARRREGGPQCCQVAERAAEPAAESNFAERMENREAKESGGGESRRW